jgi:hypothetical protein
VKADEDFVEKGMYQFSRPMINAPDVEKRVLIVETVAPFRQVQRERERERERESDRARDDPSTERELHSYTYTT